MTTWYIIDGDTIVNAVDTRTRERAEEVARLLVNGDRLRVDSNPPQAMLEGYRWWRERP